METLELIKRKIIDKEELSRVGVRARLLGKKIVFTNGCFDLLHLGHIDYLTRAADLGDCLIIGVNSDISIRKIKGNNRPIQDEQTRALLIASLTFVKNVVLFDEETPYELLNIIQPDVLVKGGDYSDITKIVGYDIVTKKGGKVVSLPFVEGYSTTSIIENIKSLH